MSTIPVPLATLLRALAVGCIALVIGTLLLRSIEQASSRQLPARLAALPASDLADACQATLQLGPAGETILIELLGHARGEVAQAAEQTLERLLSANEGPTPTHAADVAGLLMRLASGVQHLDDGGRERAARLAQQALALRQPLPPPALVDAERVLRSAIASAEPTPTNVTLSSQAPVDDADVRATAVANDASQHMTAPAAEPELFVTDDARSLAAEQNAPPTTTSTRQPAQAARRDAADGANPLAPKQRLRLVGQPSSESTSSVVLSEARTAPSAALTARDETTSVRHEASDATHELFLQLHAAEPSVRADARFELERLGLSAGQIEVGEHLTSPDADVRRTWAERLPGMRSFPARQWLLILSRDADALVRRTVLSLLATSPDQELQQRVREMAATDPDEQLRAQAESVAERQQIR